MQNTAHYFGKLKRNAESACICTVCLIHKCKMKFEFIFHRTQPSMSVLMVPLLVRLKLYLVEQGVI